MKRSLTSLAFAAAVMLASPLAAADDQLATGLFEGGMRLMDAGDYEEACAAFKRSETPEPTMATRYQRGRCNEKLERFASAQRFYLDAARMAEAEKDDARAAAARKRAVELEGRIPLMTIRVAAPVAGERLTLDGKPLGSDQWNVAIKVDPGEHVVKASAPGHGDVELRSSASVGQSNELNVPALSAGGSSAEPAPAGPVPPVPEPGGDLPPPPPGDDDDADGMRRNSSAMFWTGLSLTIAGPLMMLGGVGSWAGEECTVSEYDDFLDEEFAFEGAGFECDPPGGSIALLALGGAAIPTGIVLLVIGNKKVPIDAEASDQALLRIEPLLGAAAVRSRSPAAAAGLRVRF